MKWSAIFLFLVITFAASDYATYRTMEASKTESTYAILSGAFEAKMQDLKEFEYDRMQQHLMEQGVEFLTIQLALPRNRNDFGLNVMLTRPLTAYGETGEAYLVEKLDNGRCRLASLTRDVASNAADGRQRCSDQWNSIFKNYTVVQGLAVGYKGRRVYYVAQTLIRATVGGTYTYALVVEKRYKEVRDEIFLIMKTVVIVGLVILIIILLICLYGHRSDKKLLKIANENLRAKNKIEQQMEMQKTISYIWRHDCVNLVSPAAIAIEYQLAAGYDKGAMEMANRELQSAMKMFADLSAWQRVIEEGGQGVIKEHADLTKLVEGVTIEGANIAIGDLGTCECNHGFMISALRNLLDNAVKYAKEKPQISVTRKGNDIVIQDNAGGYGCKDGVYDHQYALLLTQARQRGDYSVEGTGLGLANTIASLDANGFTLRWRTKCGVGTRWCINIGSRA